MRILLTGGTGNVGKAAVARLVAHGHDVRVIGRRSGFEIPGAEYAVCDVTDYPSLRKNVAGCEAIVHLAALPSPGSGTSEEVFRVNAAGTYNLFQAAAEEGIKRVVQASSINALGLFYGVKPASPQYFPMDEDHPSVTTDAYSFSKTVVEEIGRYYWRREGISSVALRLPGVWAAAHRDHNAGQQAIVSGIVDRLQAMPEADRRRLVVDARSAFHEARGRGAMERRDGWRRMWDGAPLSPQEMSTLMGGAYNFWTLIDERDSAQAIEKGLTAAYEGSHPLFVHDSRNSAGIESETLARLFFPEVTARKRPLAGIETLISIDRARELIGFEPEYSFTEATPSGTA